MAGSKSDRAAGREPLSYGRYLKLDALLECQEPESARLGRPAHNEMLFIIVHQAHELWFNFLVYATPEAAAMHRRRDHAGIVTDRRGDRLRLGLGLYHAEAEIPEIASRIAAALADTS